MIRFTIGAFLALFPLLMNAQAVDSTAFGTQYLEGITVKTSRISRNSNGYKVNIESVPVLKKMDGLQLLYSLPGISLVNNQLYVKGNRVGKIYVNGREVRLQGENLLDYIKLMWGSTVKSVQVVESAGVEENSENAATAIIRITTIKNGHGGNVTLTAPVSLSSNSKLFKIPSVDFQQRAGKWSFLFMLMPSYNKFHSSPSTEDVLAGQSILSVDYLKSTTKLLNTTWGVGYDFTSNDILTISLESQNDRRNADKEIQSTTEGSMFVDAGSERHKSHGTDYTVDYQHKWRTGNMKIYGVMSHKDGSGNETIQRMENPHEWYNGNENTTDSRMWQVLVKGEQALLDERATLFGGLDFMRWSDKDKTETTRNVGEQEARSTGRDWLTYKESLMAAYTRFNYRYNRIGLSAGLRYELRSVHPFTSTESSRGLEEGGNKFNMNKLFPSLNFNYDLTNDGSYGVNASFVRSLIKPTARMISPAKAWNNEYSYTIGNPLLRAICSNKVSVGATVWRNLSLTLSRSWSPLFQQIYVTDDNADMYYSTFNDGGKTKTHSVDASYFSLLGSKGVVNASLTFAHTKSAYDQISTISNSMTAFGLASYEICKNSNATLTMNYSSPTKMPTLKIGAMFGANIGVTKSLLDNRLRLSANYEYSKQPKQYVSAEGVSSVVSPNLSPSTFSFTLAYKLSWGKKNFEIRKTGDDGRDEHSRM